MKAVRSGRWPSSMLDYGVGVAGVAAFELKRVDSDYFEEA